MATSRSDVTDPVLASPSQASAVFGLGGAHPVRQKGWFYVRFTGPSLDENRNSIGFLVKSADRPAVQPTVEELNQYGKKRLVHTGYKYQPINLSFYDTADNAILALWTSYARHYFGSFRQASKDAYRDDILDDLAGDWDAGFGFALAENPDTDDGINSQFFFEQISIYQIWGGEVTAYDLINPKITSFEPDDLDYEATGVNTFRMSINYETLSYRNSGRPFPLSGSDIEYVFAAGNILNGQVVDVEAPARVTDFTDTSDIQDTGTVGFRTAVPDSASTGNRTDNSDGQVTNGVLGSFGNFDFGSVPSDYQRPVISSTTVQRALSAMGVNGGSSESRILGDIANGAIDQVSRDLGPSGRNLDLDRIAVGIINSGKSGSSQYGRKSETTRTIGQAAKAISKLLK